MLKITEHKLYNKLKKEWHTTRNNGVIFDDFTSGSNKKVWWRCDVADDHEWDARINHRTNGVSCPYCSGRRASKLNCLSKTHPKLIREWHPTKNEGLSPNDVVAKSGKKVWWKCGVADDHEWETEVSHRTRGNGCPCCTNQKVVKSNCLETTHPELAKEWHPTKNKNLTSNDVVAGAKKKVWWKCDVADDHEWESFLYKRSNGRGCPYCVNQRVVKSNCLATTHPELAKEWHPTKNGLLKPTDIVSGATKKMWWKCDVADDHEWETTPRSRISGHNCPKCNESKGEKNIRKFLSNNNMDFETQKKFKECVYKSMLPFDFYLPNYNLLIEYDGIQHSKSVKHFGGEENFKLRKIKDKIKTDFAKNNGLNLLRINYTQFKKIELVIGDYLCIL